MSPTVIQNIMKFMERVNLVGSESIAWIEAYNSLMSELKKTQNTEAS